MSTSADTLARGMLYPCVLNSQERPNLMKATTRGTAILIAALIAPLAMAQQAATTQRVAAADTTAKAPSFKAHVLTNSELDQLLAQPGKVLVIDVRRPDEISSIGGFPVYLSIQLSQLESSLQWIPKNREIVTVSNHAARAGKAADLLAGKGFKVAGAVGAETYEKAGGTLAKVAIPQKQSGSDQGTATGSR